MSATSVIVDQRGRPLIGGSGRDTQHHAASQTAREFEGYLPHSGSPDSDNNAEIPDITARAREADRNNGLAANMRVAIGDNVVGTGLQLSPSPDWRVLGLDREEAAERAREFRAHWNDFARSRWIDAHGEDDFNALSRLIFDAEGLSGSGIGIPRWKERAGTPYRTCIQIVESDRLSNPDRVDDDARVSGGVERAADGEILGYHVQTQHPGARPALDAEERWEWIPAYHPWGRRRFIHVFEKTRPGQSRGVAAMSRVLAALGLYSKYQLTELQSQQLGAKITKVLETPLTDQQAAALFGGTAEKFAEHRGNWRVPMVAGQVLKLPVGTKLHDQDNRRPSTAFVGFMEWVTREIGAGLNLPFELATRNFSKTNYSSARAALLEAWRHFYVRRQRLIYQWAQPVYELWFEEAIELGLIEAEGFQEHRTAWTAAKWVAPAQLPIDQLKTVNAQKIQLEIRTTTRQKIAAEEGMDWEDLAEQQLVEDLKEAEIAMRREVAIEKLRVAHGLAVVPPPPPSGETDPDAPQSDEEMDERDAAEDVEAGPPDDETEAPPGAPTTE